METTHTPGPWTYKDDFELVVVPKNDPQAEAICEITGNPSEQFANARLIAAAPDLLKALQKIVQEGYNRFEKGDLDNFTGAVIETAEQAIQKATQP
jgi:hypothetical protein